MNTFNKSYDMARNSNFLPSVFVKRLLLLFVSYFFFHLGKVFYKSQIFEWKDFFLLILLKSFLWQLLFGNHSPLGYESHVFCTTRIFSIIFNKKY